MNLSLITTLFEAYKRSYNITTDFQLANRLELSKAYVCDIKKGRRRLSDELAIMMAKHAELDPQETLIRLKILYAKDKSVQMIWKKILINWQVRKE